MKLHKGKLYRVKSAFDLFQGNKLIRIEEKTLVMFLYSFKERPAVHWIRLLTDDGIMGDLYICHSNHEIFFEAV